MAKKLPRSITRVGNTAVPEDDEALKKARERFGSKEALDSGRGAWAQAGASVMSSELEKLHAERIAKLLSGDLVIELDPAQVVDEAGSDRSNQWVEDEAFDALKASIADNGQDVPIQVSPVGGRWNPVFDETDGIVTKGITFAVISGRRRLEAIRQLGKTVRAVCVPLDSGEPSFDQLYRRFRENAERENLSLLDEFLSIGEMFSHAKTLDPKTTGRMIAKKLGMPEPRVSRGRALFENKERLFREVASPHDLTFHEIDAIIPALRKGEKLPDLGKDAEKGREASAAPPHTTRSRVVPLKRTQIIKGRKITAKARLGKITIDLGDDAKVDEALLDHLLLFIQQKGRSQDQ